MKKISDIISTPVISLFESDYLGIIYNIMFDNKQRKCKYAFILNEKENLPAIVKFNDFYKIGNDCIFIKNKASLDIETNYEKEIEECSNPINLKVYNLEGNFLGISHDITIDNNYNISEILLNNGTIINNNDIINIGKSVILISNTNTNISKFKPKQKIIKDIGPEKNVIILNKFVESKPEMNIQEKSIQNNKIITDFRFLVGRILNKDIVAFNGDIIAKTGSTITKEIVNKASSYGKLVEIARYSNKKQ